MPLTEPAHVGPAGRAFNVNGPLEEYHRSITVRPHAGVANWLLDCPDQTPFWRWYRLSCVHLRAEEDIPEGVVTEPGATHEWLLVALQPDTFDEDDPSTWLRYLEPINFVGQYIVPSVGERSEDEVAEYLTMLLAWAVTQGELWAEPPLSGQTEPWHTMLQQTITHVREGKH